MLLRGLLLLHLAFTAGIAYRIWCPEEDDCRPYLRQYRSHLDSCETLLGYCEGREGAHHD